MSVCFRYMKKISTYTSVLANASALYEFYQSLYFREKELKTLNDTLQNGL